MPNFKSAAEWLQMVVHDLKSPVNSVSGTLDMIEHMGPLNEKQQHYVKRAFAGLHRMDHLISRLLDISWVDGEGPLELRDVYVPAMVAEVIDMLQEVAEQRRVTFEVDIPEDVGSIPADGERLIQVFDNLFSNAIKYNREGGVVRVRVTRDHRHILVSVADSGIGISPQDQPHVFERFYRAAEGVRLKIEGSGLGLAISQGILARHGGRIWVESQVGEGSVFHFTLPLSQAITDGDDSSDDTLPSLGEGHDGRPNARTPFASEIPDAVDDDIQEKRDSAPPDVAGDEL
ncbi:MAG: HAMP domain-containing histidine kinase [Anaerolineae bacterium]|nr:HAMP domain-containing histidine kinase [Anaerolineae bacterium]